MIARVWLRRMTARFRGALVVLVGVAVAAARVASAQTGARQNDAAAPPVPASDTNASSRSVLAPAHAPGPDASTAAATSATATAASATSASASTAAATSASASATESTAKATVPALTPARALAPRSAIALAPAFVAADVFEGVHLASEIWTRAVTTASAGTRRFDFDLPRVEGGAAFFCRRWWSELRVEGIRSAGQASGFGIDGDSVVLRVKRARLGGVARVGQVWFSVEAGLVADPWLQYQDQNQAMRAWGPALVERWFGTSSSDVGGIVQLAHRRGRLALMASNGEGRVFVERNTQKNLLAVIDAVPWDGVLAGRPARVLFHVYGRNGTLGSSSVRSDRAGAALRLVSRYGALHAEGGQAWGVGDNASAAARAVEASVYVSAGEAVGLRGVVVGGRGQRVRLRDATLGGGGTATLWQVGIGWDNAVDLPVAAPWAQRFARVWLVAEQSRRTGDAAPAGLAQGAVTSVYLLFASQQVAGLPGLTNQ